MNRLFLLFTTSLFAQAVYGASTQAPAPWTVRNNKASKLPDKDKKKLNALFASTQKVERLRNVDANADWETFDELTKKLVEQMGRAKSGLSASGIFNSLSADDRIQGIKDSVAYIKQATISDLKKNHEDAVYRRINTGLESILAWPKKIEVNVSREQAASRATTKISSNPPVDLKASGNESKADNSKADNKVEAASDRGITFQNGTRDLALYMRIHEGKSSVVPKMIGPGKTETVPVLISGSGVLNVEIGRAYIKKQFFSVKAPSGGWSLGKGDKIVLRDNPVEMVLIRANSQSEEKLDMQSSK